MTKLIILDRDGVINEDSDQYIRSPEEWQPIPGSLAAISRLHQAGYIIAIATNQSGVGREYFDAKTLGAIHQKMSCLVSSSGGHIDYIAICPHTPDDSCSCRKPGIGLLLEIGRVTRLPLGGCWFIGDSESDLLAAAAAGCIPVLVRTGKGQLTLQKNSEKAAFIFDDLAAAVVYLTGELFEEG